MASKETTRVQDRTYELLQERIAYLEHLKSFHDEIVKIIRIYTSNDAFTSERCLKEIVTFIQKKFDFYMVNILLMDEISRELVLYVAAGEEVLNPLVKNFRIRVGEGLTGQAAKTGASVVVNDVALSPAFIRGPLPDTQSEMCVPVKIKHRIVGVLDLQDKVRDRFQPEFIHLVEDITLDVGLVLETKRLYDDLRRYSEELERKVEEKVQAIQKSERQYRTIVENVTDPIITADLSGRLTWANRAFQSLVGYPGADLLHMNLSRFVKKGNLHRLYTVLRDVNEGRTVPPFELGIETHRGEDKIVEFTCVALQENGQVSGLEATLRDITERAVVEKLKKNYMKTLEDEVVQRIAEIKDTQRAAILAIANLAESIDDDTGGHIQRIRHYSKTLADDMKKSSRYRGEMSEEYAELIYELSPLHDLGKVGIRDYILQKPDKLTDREFEKMKDHCEIGAHALRMAGQMIHRESIFSIGEMIARFHHERWDGTGYPAVEIDGEFRPLRGEEIPLCARIVAVADVYDALTSKRPYKMPFPHEKAREMLEREAGGHFDPEVIQSFLRCEAEFLRIRRRFPDTDPPEGKPFELPARDRISSE